MALGDKGKGFITRKLSLEVAPAEVGSDDSESPFLERVETHLPCYCVERDVPIERYKSTLMSWKIDAERIIGVFVSVPSRICGALVWGASELTTATCGS